MATTSPTALASQAILQTAFDRLENASSYRFDIDILVTLSGEAFETGVEVPIHFFGDAQPPDRMQGAVRMTRNGVDVETPVIIIGDSIYAKNPLTDKWLITPATWLIFKPENLVMDSAAVSELELLADEKVNDIPVYHLSGRARLPFDLGTPIGIVKADTRVSYWIGREDQQLLRVTLAGDTSFGGQMTGTATISMTMSLFDYGAPVKITTPEMLSATILSVPNVAQPITITATLLPPLTADTPEGHLQRGLISLADGRFGLASAHFNRALALRPEWTDALLYLGTTTAIDGDVETAMKILDRVIAAEPDRADAYTLRAWAHLRAIVRKKEDSDTAIPKARTDIARALILNPKSADAAAMRALADLLEALNRLTSNQVQAGNQFEVAMADLEALQRQDPDAAAGRYLTMLQILAARKMGDRAWLSRQADEATRRLTQEPTSYSAYAVRGLMNLLLGSQPTPNMETVRGAGNDLLFSIALMHERMPTLADPIGGPLQVARIWDLQEAAYSGGNLYAKVFFNQNPQLFPEFAHMLTSYWELHDIFAEIVDDPIIFSVAFSPDGRQIATLSESAPSYLRIWDAVSREKLREVELGLDGRVIATTDGNLDYSPDGKRIIVAYTNPVIRVIDVETGKVALEIKHDKAARSVAFSPDGKRLLTVDPADDIPTLWDAETGRLLTRLEGGSTTSAADFSPDGRYVVGSGDQTHVWDAESGKIIATVTGRGSNYIQAPSISPDGRLIAVPGNPVRVYDLDTQKELFALTIGASMVTFSPDSARLATSGDGLIGVWDATTGASIFMAGHARGADAVAFSPDGRLLATGGFDGRFRIWDTKTGRELWNGLTVTLWWQAKKN